jgi:hypothetical protein
VGRQRTEAIVPVGLLRGPITTAATMRPVGDAAYARRRHIGRCRSRPTSLPLATSASLTVAAGLPCIRVRTGLRGGAGRVAACVRSQQSGPCQPRLLLLCLLLRTLWLTVEGGRHGAAGVLHRRGGRAALAVSVSVGWWRANSQLSPPSSPDFRVLGRMPWSRAAGETARPRPTRKSFRPVRDFCSCGSAVCWGPARANVSVSTGGPRVNPPRPSSPPDACPTAPLELMTAVAPAAAPTI